MGHVIKMFHMWFWNKIKCIIVSPRVVVVEDLSHSKWLLGNLKKQRVNTMLELSRIDILETATPGSAGRKMKFRIKIAT